MGLALSPPYPSRAVRAARLPGSPCHPPDGRSFRAVATAYEAASPGAAVWILDQAARNSDHIRTTRALQLQQRDLYLHRLLPFGVVLIFLIASVAFSHSLEAKGPAPICLRPKRRCRGCFVHQATRTALIERDPSQWHPDHKTIGLRPPRGRQRVP